VEPWVAVDPTDGNHLVGASQRDRWNDGGASGLASAYNNDGGGSWSGVVPLPFTSSTAARAGAHRRS
jgi:hypothetical protein